jgi:hypothetical protein
MKALASIAFVAFPFLQVALIILRAIDVVSIRWALVFIPTYIGIVVALWSIVAMASIADENEERIMASIDGEEAK